MTQILVKLIKCYDKVRQLEHHYWMHLAQDVALDEMCIPNIQRIVEKMSGRTIDMKLLDFPGHIIRGITLRYKNPDVDKIRIRLQQASDWQRFTAVKELCHPLLDTDEDFHADPTETIKSLLGSDGFAFLNSQSEAVKSEHLAELMAIEILYPIEWRERDLADYSNGKPLDVIAKERQIPLKKVEQVLTPTHVEGCKGWWKLVSNAAPPSPLVWE